MSEIIAHSALLQLVDSWIADGKQVAAPSVVKAGAYWYVPVSSSAQIALTAETAVRPRNSIKEFLFPRHERLYGYRFVGQKIEVDDFPPPGAPQVILGARPCDAAALPILDHLFTWDYEDKFYTTRRKSTTVVSLACPAHDGQCFCTSVGLGPAAELGSDATLIPLDDGGYEVRCFTDKGTALFEGKTQSSSKIGHIADGPEPKFDTEALGRYLRGNFDDPMWKEFTLRCLGCAACAYTCPTCHCFDIVDEGNASGGCRVKNWDSCQFCMFTMHASGHNPRTQQFERQRQRLQHKFRIYPEKFGTLLCTGCGNCTRNCPVGLGVQSVIAGISQTVGIERAD